MKKLLLLFSISTMLQGYGCSMAHANVNFGSDMEVINAFPIAAVTASGDSTAVDLLKYDGQCAVVADVSAPVAGTNPTLDLSLKESSTSGGEYTAISNSKFIGGAFTQVSGDASVQRRAFNKNAVKRYVKWSRAIGGTSSPQYLLSGKIYCQKKYK